MTATDRSPHVPDLVNDQTRKDLARIVAKLFERWGLNNEEQLALLGLSKESRKLLPAYRRGERALPANRDTLDRAGYLMGIHKGLRLLYPRDEEIRFGWVRYPNALLGNQPPLEVMLKDGLVGLARVARFVDFQRGM